MDNRQKLLNVELTLEAVQACLFVLDISNRISIQIANKKYFSALRVRFVLPHLSQPLITC